jgi:hypothetical protein
VALRREESEEKREEGERREYVRAGSSYKIVYIIKKRKGNEKRQ